MNCPYCRSEIKAYTSIQTESEDMVVTHIHQWWRCRRCGEYFYALLIEYVFDESLTHYGYRAAKEVWKNDLKRIKKCRDKKNPHCRCDAHKAIDEISSHYTEAAWHSYTK